MRGEDVESPVRDRLLGDGVAEAAEPLRQQPAAGLLVARRRVDVDQLARERERGLSNPFFEGGPRAGLLVPVLDDDRRGDREVPVRRLLRADATAAGHDDGSFRHDEWLARCRP